MDQLPKGSEEFRDDEIIKLTREGIWLADQHEITHEATRKLFSRSLYRGSDPKLKQVVAALTQKLGPAFYIPAIDPQAFYLVIGSEFKKVEVEDTPYFVHRIDGQPQTGVTLWVSDGTQEVLDPKTLNYGGAYPGRLICTLKNGLLARIIRPAYADLLLTLKEDSMGHYLEFNYMNYKAYLKEPA